MVVKPSSNAGDEDAAATARATELMMDRHYIRKTSFRGRKRSRERDFFTIVAPAEC
jgi:hypothetical protein